MRRAHAATETRHRVAVPYVRQAVHIMGQGEKPAVLAVQGGRLMSAGRWFDDMVARGAAAVTAKKPRDPKATSKPLEMDGQKAVVDWLRKCGCITSRNINELRADEKDPIKRARFWMALLRSGCTKGFPDLTAITQDGRTIYVEMKRAGARPSDYQAALHAVLVARGAVVVWGTDIWSVQEALRAQGVALAPVPVSPL
jgi:hypothetical protein